MIARALIGRARGPGGRGMLRDHGVTHVADIRIVPGSRRNPQYNRDALAAALGAVDIGYSHRPGLGGLRHPRPDSVNTGWRNLSFRGYADYMQTQEFAAGVDAVVALAADAQHAALMCAEALPWRCHRSLIADALAARGVPVEHIIGATRRPHTLTPSAHVDGTRVTYPAPAATRR